MRHSVWAWKLFMWLVKLACRFDKLRLERIAGRWCRTWHYKMAPGRRSVLEFTTRGLDQAISASCMICGKSCTFEPGEAPLLQEAMNRQWIRAQWMVDNDEAGGIVKLTELTVWFYGQERPRKGKKIRIPGASEKNRPTLPTGAIPQGGL